MPPRQHTPEQYLAAVIRNKGCRASAARELKVAVRTVIYNLSQLRAQGVQVPESTAGLTGQYDIPAALEVNGISRAAQATIDDLRGQLEAVTQVKQWAARKAKRKPPGPRGAKHLLIPDTQVKTGVEINHLAAAGNYAAEKRPDTIVIIGDWFDMPSLSSWDVGTLAFEGRRYRLDIESGKAAMELFLKPIRKVRGYDPRIVFTTGNHEWRIDRAVQKHSHLEGFMSRDDFQLKAFGIEEHEFLKVVTIDGVCYSHYFPRGTSGKVGQSKNGAPNAKAQLLRQGRSAVSGHVQGLDLYCQALDGRLQWGVMAGSLYQHDEGFLTPQGNDHFRGLMMFHEVINGAFTPMVVSLDYLLSEYI